MEFEGIVIRSTPFRDHDAMVTVLSNDKMRSFLVKALWNTIPNSVLV